jgi:hypothetical protein
VGAAAELHSVLGCAHACMHAQTRIAEIPDIKTMQITIHQEEDYLV